MDPKAEELVRRINEETADIHDIGVDVYKDVPMLHIIPIKMYRLSELIAADIFSSAGIQRHEAEGCFEVIAGRITDTKLLGCSTLERYEGMGFLLRHAAKVVRLQAETEKMICPSASVMGCIIAVIAYRKLQAPKEGFFQEVVKVFGELNAIQWLSVAIQVYAKVKGCAFTIELDESSEKPVAELRNVDGKSRWVVKTRMPEMNKYEGIFRDTFCAAVQHSSPMVPKQEPDDDNVLPSVEPNDTTNEPITLSDDDDDETEDGTITLRDYARQMKILSKRLATPDRAIARRARKDIMKKPGQVGEQEVDEVGPPKEYFDSYTHLKDVWKTCLQNQVSIPNSLRVLVDHHCTPSQVFHLMELEKEHLAEVGMEVDG